MFGNDPVKDIVNPLTFQFLLQDCRLNYFNSSTVYVSNKNQLILERRKAALCRYAKNYDPKVFVYLVNCINS